MKRPEKMLYDNPKEETVNLDANVFNNGYNAGLQAERDYRDWLIDNAKIEEAVIKAREEALSQGFIEDKYFSMIAEAIRSLLKVQEGVGE